MRRAANAASESAGRDPEFARVGQARDVDPRGAPAVRVVVVHDDGLVEYVDSEREHEEWVA